MDILEEPNLKDLVVKAGLIGNPVYISLLRNIQKCRDQILNTVGKTKGAMMMMPFMLLETGLTPVNEQFDELRSVVRNGWTPFHQTIMLMLMMQKYMHDNNIKATDPQTFIQKHPELFDMHALNAVNNIAMMCNLENPVQACNMLVPIPRAGCEYVRLSPKAQEYVMSLGIPSKDVLIDFYDELGKKAEMNGGMYESVVQLTINSKPTFIYYAYCFDGFVSIRYGTCDIENEFCWDYRCAPQDMKRTLDSEMDDEDILEVRGLLANIWASIVTKSFEPSSEPDENRTYINRTVPVQKANYSSYRYIKITPECEEKYEESKKVLSAARSDATYRKTMWFTRAYYAHRGPTKQIVLCKASIHHRKCGEVLETPITTVLV